MTDTNEEREAKLAQLRALTAKYENEAMLARLDAVKREVDIRLAGKEAQAYPRLTIALAFVASAPFWAAMAALAVLAAKALAH